MNKLFLNLNKEILRYDNTAENYVQKFIYALSSKKESSRFPDDNEFMTALASKQVYLMRGKYKAYLFERFENYGTVETKDVFTHLDNSTYSIEHIMPQHLTPAWTESLGPEADEIHETWLHRLANLTLTGYNPNLSNKPFAEKRDAEVGGYAVSGLKMNQKIATKDSWGLPELEERNDEMIALAKKIWAYPETTFVPAEKEYDSCTLDDEDIELTGREIIKYSYQDFEQPVSSWMDMFEHVVKYLHQRDKSVLSGLAYSTSSATDLVNYINSAPDGLRSALQIDENIYIERNTSTTLKTSILRRLFAMFDADPMDLVFYLKDEEKDKATDATRYEIRKRYWEYALPIIQKKHELNGSYSNCSPGTSNTVSGFFGISGFYISCVANFESARVDFVFGKRNTDENKSAFNVVSAHKEEIEEKVGVKLDWERADEYKASWITYHLNDVSVANEADWLKMAEFHAEWSYKIRNAILPYLQEMKGSDDKADKVAEILREWTKAKDDVNDNLAKCNRTYTRFTTDEMTAILPDIPEAPSGWNTDNHYFYEIINRDGKNVFIKFVISAKNITDDFRDICNRINELYPSSRQNEDWKWRQHFRTKTVEIDDEIDKEKIFSSLDDCLDEIKAFEKELAEQLSK